MVETFHVLFWIVIVGCVCLGPDTLPLCALAVLLGVGALWTLGLGCPITHLEVYLDPAPDEPPPFSGPVSSRVSRRLARALGLSSCKHLPRVLALLLLAVGSWRTIRPTTSPPPPAAAP
jgi:hypothetical protein